MDAALRRAIAKFRFDVAECEMAGTTFNKEGTGDPNNKFGFGCSAKTPLPKPSPRKGKKRYEK